MEQSKLDRINALAKIKKEVGLTPEETIEQAELRKEYIGLVTGNLKQTLNTISIKEADGSIKPLNKK